MTITVRKKSTVTRKVYIGKITDGLLQKNQITELCIEIGDFCRKDLIESICPEGLVETDVIAQETILNRERRALKDIKYNESENSELAKIIAFPEKALPIEPVKIDNFFNANLDSSQKLAVCKALATDSIFLIQGPPGTGKTSVITEIVLQILKNEPNAKILISSQSNVAVDNVLEKVYKTDKSIKILRIGKEDKISPDAQKFEVEKVIFDWQKDICDQSINNWQIREEENSELQHGSEQFSSLEVVKVLQEKRNINAEKLISLIPSINSDFLICNSPTSAFILDELYDKLAEKTEIETKLINLVKNHATKYGLELLENTPLSEWMSRESDRIKEILGDNNEKYEQFLRLKDLHQEWCDRLRKEDRDLIPLFLKKVNIIGATCIGIAKGIANIKNIKFDWVIIDEAGRSTPAETFVPMSKGQKIILVGDQNQLPPIVDQEIINRLNASDKINENTQKEIDEIKIKQSLFARLIEKLPESNKTLLSNQYRMHPHIGYLVSKNFYESQISSDNVIIEEKQHNLESFNKHVYWVTTSDENSDLRYEKQLPGSKSFINEYEAQVIEALLKNIQSDCGNQNLTKEVGIIVSYLSQKKELEKRLTPKVQKSIFSSLKLVINTVDAFQGEERDIIIYDLVRSSKHKKLGHTSDYRRLNVALSRAKQLLIIVRDHDMAYEGKIPQKNITKKNMDNPFRQLLEDIFENEFCQHINSKEILS